MDNNWRKGQRKMVYFMLLVSLTLFIVLTARPWSRSESVTAAASTSVRRVNMPYLGKEPPVELFEPAIFWFGKVDRTSNYADVRMWYYDKYVKLYVNIIDRLLWYDKNPTRGELSEWDAVTLYINLDGNIGGVPGLNSYRLVGQLNWFEGRANWQAAYRGNGTTWVENPISYTADSGFRGGTNNDKNAAGWSLTVIIPFASLGLSSQPPYGTVWGLGVALHDRDNSSGSPAIPDQIWPEHMNPRIPSTWGQLHFGIPGYNSPNSAPKGITTIRHGLNGASVIDGHVGGHGNCGNDLNKWTEWGEKNYAGYGQFNIQNQWDVSDFPCFSKYFVTFPLDDVPPGKIIITATLKMELFGGSANPNGETPDSYIQVLTVGEDWDESTLSWNNAPLAVENFTGTWVKPTWLSPQLDYYWNVTRAAAEAYQSGEPLKLAMYSADGERHTGKYFWSSDSGVKNTSQRPSLQVVWGVPCDSPGVECEYNYLPLVLQ